MPDGTLTRRALVRARRAGDPPQQGVRWFAGLAGAKGIGAKIMAALKVKPSYFKPIIGLERGLTDPITELNMGQTAEVVGQLFGFVGLFVAVPILSLIIITVEEFWIKPVEEGHAEERRSELELPDQLEQELAPDPGEAPPLRPAS